MKTSGFIIRVLYLTVAIILTTACSSTNTTESDKGPSTEENKQTSATDKFEQNGLTTESFVPGQDLGVNFVFVIDTSISMQDNQMKVADAARGLFDTIGQALPNIGTVRVSAITSNTFKSPSKYVGDPDLHNPSATAEEQLWEPTFCGDPNDPNSPYNVGPIDPNTGLPNGIPTYCIDWVANGFNGMTPFLNPKLASFTYSDGTYLTGNEPNIDQALFDLALMGAGTHWIESLTMPILEFLDNDVADLALKNPNDMISFIVVGDSDDSSDIHNNPGDGYLQNCRTSVDGTLLCHNNKDSRIDNGDPTDVSNYANYQGMDVGNNDFAYNYLMNAKPDPRLISLNSITAIQGLSESCSEAIETTFRQLQQRWAADHGVGGYEGDICNPDYTQAINRIADDAASQLEKQYNLNDITEDYANQYFSVAVDGGLQDPTTYTVTIDFDNGVFIVLLDDAPPTANSTVDVQYLLSKTSHQLSFAPVIPTIKVYFVSNDGNRSLVDASEYSFDSDSNSIVFNDLNYAAPNQKIEVDYDLAFEL